MTGTPLPREPGRRRAARALPPPGPARTLYWATLVNMTGTGMYVTSSAVFFVRYVGMPTDQVGLGLTIGGLVGLTAGVPIGRLADRRGPRDVYLTTLALEAAAMCLLLAVRSFWEFTAVTTLTGLAAASSNAARGPLIRAVAADDPTRLRAHLRSVTNIGITLGGAAAGWAIAANTRSGYPLLILGNAASFALCALLVRRLPRVRPVGAAERPGRRRALADRPYLGLTAVNLVMMFQYPVLPLILPLWILGHTDVPHWAIAAVIPVNTIMVAALQVRMSRGIDGPLAAARLMPRAGLALTVSFLLIAGLGALPGRVGTAVLAVVVVVYTLGEILFATASYELSFELAPAAAQGQYLGVYNLGGGLGRVVSPSVVTFLCLGVGGWGWLVLGSLMLGAGLVTPSVARWALRTAGAREPVAAGSLPPVVE
ncbi:MFS transporter [Kitasatospora sp. NPDC101157]|uniref:MFS transporter n=1 Tax=Kitasatospora sp. NPDC101157 TaxID=3364098 RepID=UPI0038244A47